MEYNLSKKMFLDEKIAQPQLRSCKHTKVSHLTTITEKEACLSNESQKNCKRNSFN